MIVVPPGSHTTKVTYPVAFLGLQWAHRTASSPSSSDDEEADDESELSSDGRFLFSSMKELMPAIR